MLELQNEEMQTRSGYEFQVEMVILTPTLKEKESNEKDILPTDRTPDVLTISQIWTRLCRTLLSKNSQA